MGSLSIWHWLIVLLAVTMVFGTKKLRHIGSDLGGAVKNFKEGMRAEDQTEFRIKEGVPSPSGDVRDHKTNA